MRITRGVRLILFGVLDDMVRIQRARPRRSRPTSAARIAAAKAELATRGVPIDVRRWLKAAPTRSQRSSLRRTVRLMGRADLLTLHRSGCRATHAKLTTVGLQAARRAVDRALRAARKSGESI